MKNSKICEILVETITTNRREANGIFNKILCDFVDTNIIKLPFAINEKFLCDPSRFSAIQKTVEDKLAGLKWDVNSHCLSAHINPKNHPTLPEIEFFSDEIRAQIRKYLRLKFAFTLVHRNCVDFEVENAQKIAEEWFKEVLDNLVVKITSENYLIHQQTLEAIEFCIDFKENSKLSSRDNAKRQRTGNSGDSSKSTNSPSLENLSVRNQQTAKLYNKFSSDANKSSKKHQTLTNRSRIDPQELLWKKSIRKMGQSHSKGKKGRDKQRFSENYATNTLKKDKEVSEEIIDELDESSEKERKVQKDKKSQQRDAGERAKETITNNRQTDQQINKQGMKYVGIGVF